MAAAAHAARAARIACTQTAAALGGPAPRAGLRMLPRMLASGRPTGPVTRESYEREKERVRTEGNRAEERKRKTAWRRARGEHIVERAESIAAGGKERARLVRKLLEDGRHRQVNALLMKGDNAAHASLEEFALYLELLAFQRRGIEARRVLERLIRRANRISGSAAPAAGDNAGAHLRDIALHPRLWEAAAQACARARRVQLTFDVLQRYAELDRGQSPTYLMVLALAEAWAERGVAPPVRAIMDACAATEHLPVTDALWRTLLRAHCAREEWDEACAAYEEMKDFGIAPSPETSLVLLEYCAVHGLAEPAVRLYSEAVRSSSASLEEALLGAHRPEGSDVARVRLELLRFNRRNLFKRFVHQREMERLQGMSPATPAEASRVEAAKRCEPLVHAQALSLLAKALAAAGQASQVIWLLLHSHDAHFHNSVDSWHEAARGAALHGDVTTVRRLTEFAQGIFPRGNTSSGDDREGDIWTSVLIEAHVRSGQLEAALTVLEENPQCRPQRELDLLIAAVMQSDDRRTLWARVDACVRLTSGMWVTAIQALCGSGQVAVARRVLLIDMPQRDLNTAKSSLWQPVFRAYADMGMWRTCERTVELLLRADASISAEIYRALVLAYTRGATETETANVAQLTESVCAAVEIMAKAHGHTMWDSLYFARHADRVGNTTLATMFAYMLAYLWKPETKSHIHVPSYVTNAILDWEERYGSVDGDETDNAPSSTASSYLAPSSPSAPSTDCSPSALPPPPPPPFDVRQRAKELASRLRVHRKVERRSNSFMEEPRWLSRFHESGEDKQAVDVKEFLHQGPFLSTLTAETPVSEPDSTTGGTGAQPSTTAAMEDNVANLESREEMLRYAEQMQSTTGTTAPAGAGDDSMSPESMLLQLVSRGRE